MRAFLYKTQGRTNLGALRTDGKIARISGVVLCLDPSCVSPEDIAYCDEVLGALKHDLTGITLGDLDVPFEDVGVSEDELQCGNSHALGDGHKVEDTLVLDAGHVEQAFLAVLESIENHLRHTLDGLCALLGVEKILPLIDVLAPDLLRIPSSTVLPVFVDISNNVGLLEELTHRLGQ